MFDALAKAPRLLMESVLRPVQGERFQPTGFADIGHAAYGLPNGTRMLLVETAQSMANRLEATCIGPDGEIIPELQGLPYVRVRLTGGLDARTTSLVEAHRINSPFIFSDKEFSAKFADASGYRAGSPLDWRRIARAFFRFDPNSLLHGVFLANYEDGRVRLQRLLSAFIEARNVREAVSGGVKNSFLDPSGKYRAVGYDKDVYGNVPFHRVEYTAEATTAYFNLDLSLLRGYGLGPAAEDLLISLALFKVRRFLSHGTRLRTACDLAPEVPDPVVVKPSGFAPPAEAALLDRLQSAIKRCGAEGLFDEEPVTVLTTQVKKRDKREDEQGDAAGDQQTGAEDQ